MVGAKTYEDVKRWVVFSLPLRTIISEIKNDELEFNNLAYRQLFDEYYKMMTHERQPEAALYVMPTLKSVR